MDLKSDRRQHIQLELDFSFPRSGESCGTGREEIESPSAAHDTESPASTDRWMEEVCERDNLKEALRQVKASQTYLKFFESASLGDLLGRIAEDGCNPVAVVVGVDEGGPLDAVATLPSDGEFSIGFLQVNRFGLSASG